MWNLGDFLVFFIIGLLILTWFFLKSILIHNILLILGIAGVGSVTGLRIDGGTAIIILAIFSIYDYIAVYKTKHMIKMAREMAEGDALMAFIIPQNLADFKKDLKEVKPGGNFLILGGGDIAFPLLFATSLLSSGIANSIVVAIFSFIGLIASFLIFIFQKERQPIPALPPIALFSIIGYLVTRLI